MKEYKYYAWSSGLEIWEEIDISFEEYLTWEFLYIKRINGKEVRICKDSCNRFVAAIEK